MTLSPSTVILIGIGLPPGNVMVQPDVFPVATMTDVVGVVSPVVGTELMFHVPATSARLIGAGAVVVVEEATAVLVSTAALSFLAHPARTAAQAIIAMLVERWSVSMDPPSSGYKRHSPA
jgi:hypothetical protein